jgi:DMSO/TMAO reductase YedYZ heme-binding membrane subunit
MSIRAKVLLFAFALSLTIAAYGYFTIPTPSLLALELTQYFGFIGLGLLFLALTPGPLYRLFPALPGSISHRAYLGPLGISCFYFTLLHALFGFFGPLEGFEGLSYLPGKYLVAAALGFGGLLILAALAGTSFDWARAKLGAHWKRLHRAVYFAAFFAAAHASMAGSNFADPASPIAVLWTILFLAIVLLHAFNLNRFLAARFPAIPSYIWTAHVLLALAAGLYILHLLQNYAHGAHN